MIRRGKPEEWKGGHRKPPFCSFKRKALVDRRRIFGKSMKQYTRTTVSDAVSYHKRPTISVPPASSSWKKSGTREALLIFLPLDTFMINNCITWIPNQRLNKTNYKLIYIYSIYTSCTALHDICILWTIVLLYEWMKKKYINRSRKNRTQL